MTTSSVWPDRLARTFAVLRGAMVAVFSAVLIIAPETAMPGSSTEPGRSLGLVFASRTTLLVVLVALALRRKREGLGSPVGTRTFSRAKMCRNFALFRAQPA